MAKHHNPKVVTTNLLLNLDFKNSKRFSTTLGTNLVTDANYNASTWSSAFYGYKTTGIDAPDGSKTAVRVTGKVIFGTYTLTTNVVTVTSTNHGLSGGNHYFDFTSGTAPDGFYTVTVVDVNTFTIPVTSANTSGNVTIQCRSGQRINITAFTPNGTDTYTISFWARLISSGDYGATAFTTDLADGNPTLNYTSQLIQNKWVFIVANGIPTATSKGFLDLIGDQANNFAIDFWGVKLENQTANNTSIPIKDTVGGYTFNLYRPQYSTLSDSDITFTRTATAPKWGGVVTTTGTGSLTSANFLYNDHTWEVWFKINDVTPTNIPTYETMSCLAMYSGYHCGFYYSASQMQYLLWNSSTAVVVATWSVGTSGAQINQGSWYQIVITRSGNVFTPYLNGVPLGTGSTTVTAVLASVSNNIWLGGCANLAAGSGDFLNYAKNTVANMKMYNRALTAAEISQNFNALRGRFGI